MCFNAIGRPTLTSSTLRSLAVFRSTTPCFMPIVLTGTLMLRYVWSIPLIAGVTPLLTFTLSRSRVSSPRGAAKPCTHS